MINKKIPYVNLSNVVTKNDPHIRWDFEKSPNSSEDRGLVRYHFVVVDNRNLQEKMKKILNKIQRKSIKNFPFDKVDESSGIVDGSEKDLEYLYRCYDTEYTPHYVDFSGISNKIKKDSKLLGRKVIFNKDYLERIYGPRH